MLPSSAFDGHRLEAVTQAFSTHSKHFATHSDLAHGCLLPGLNMTQCSGTHLDYQTVQRPEPRYAYLVGGIGEKRAIWIADGPQCPHCPSVRRDLAKYTMSRLVQPLTHNSRNFLRLAA